MFEDFSYEFMLKRMLLDIQENYPNLDMREGSMVYNSIAASAMELSTCFICLDSVLEQSFIETADRTNLYRLSEQMGIDTSVYNATKGKFKLKFDKSVPLRSVWMLDENRYIVEKELPKEEPFFVYEAECQTPGSKPNSITGTLSAVSEQSNKYTYSELTGSIVQGRNEFTDNEIREYYITKVKGTAVDGNKAQYEVWCKLYDGIGEYKVFPLWNGANTVKVSILNEVNSFASEELIKEFQDYLDPGSTGMGDGKAPIGAKVTVVTADAHPINVNAKIITNIGELRQIDVEEILNNYFGQRAFKSNYVSYSQIIASLLNNQYIQNVTNITINGGTQDIKLEDNEIPTVGTCNFEIVVDKSK